jgi:hypothetical protein
MGARAMQTSGGRKALAPRRALPERRRQGGRMELVFILGLAALGLWCWAQTQRIETLTRKLEELERRLAEREGELPPLLLDQPLPPDEEPLLLDTPLPEASNDALPSPPEPVSAQAVGVGVLVAALLAPALTGLAGAPGVSLYLCAAGAAALSFAAQRRWVWLALASLVGMHLWFAASIAAGDTTRALALIGVASIGAALLSLRSSTSRGWSYLRTLAPGAAVSIGAVLLGWTWLAAAPGPPELVAGPALLSAIHVLLAAWLVRGRGAAPHALAVAIAALLAGAVLYRSVRADAAPLGGDFYPAILISALIVMVSALGARMPRSNAAIVAASGAGGAALLVLLAAFSSPDWHSLSAWGALFIGAAMLFAAAWRAAADVAEPRSNSIVAIWAGAGAALAILGMESLFPASVRTAGQALAALAFAAALAWRGWRIFGLAAIVAAVIAIAHALAPLLGEAASAGARDYAALGAAAALLFGASAILSLRTPEHAIAGALSSAAIAVVVVAMFIALAGWVIAPFAEAAARALVLIAAGHVLASFEGVGEVAKWRGHALIGAGLLYALAIPGAELNPWWGAVAAFIGGPPLVNVMALAFAAPAVLGFAAAWRFYERQLVPARLYAGAGSVLLLIWLALELRRTFHGAAMSEGPVGLTEGAGYALIALGFACVLAIAARARSGASAMATDLPTAARIAAWGAVLFAAFVLLIVRHPWWGAHDAETTGDNTALVAVLMQLAACALALVLGRALSMSRGAEPTGFAAATFAALMAWSFGHAAIRWLYHSGAMDDGGALVGLEGFAHALWPLVFISVSAWATARAPGRDTVRAYLFDLQALWSAAIWPALAFAALGLWLLFDPWWGMTPATLSSPLAAAVAIASYLFAAALSAAAPRIPHVRWKARLAQAATAAWIGHLLVAIALAVRWLHRGESLRDAPLSPSELWTLALSWSLLAVAVWFTRPQREEQRLRGIDLFAITPGARRERRYGRRQRS